MSDLEGIAIIAMQGRFPGADSVEEFWQNLTAGRDTISFFSDQELADAGLNVEALREQGNYVPARGVVRDAECFDREFFGIHPKEAEVLDPQHRIFLEGCWEALERSGYAPGRIDVPVGVYCGATYNTYFMHALHKRPQLIDLVGRDQVMFGNEKDYIATRTAYKLNLSGPAISLNTACSSSLTAICQACQSLLTYQCDMAVAGGVSLTVPQTRGYHFQEGDIGSPDGHTRTFDIHSQGTVFSNGLALLVLKRVDEAVADGDQIYGVIKGFALNNDGADRVSFGAPGVEGQAEVVSMAQALAGVEADEISYVEAHGTATPVGDPIEVAALTEAFRRSTSRKQYCAIGSVKTNIGHLDAAAGAAGVIKTALALHHRQIPANPHFTQPNPKLDLENSPFYVNTDLIPWQAAGPVRRCAGVSSFGTGGTNAHVIVEEAPELERSGPSRPQQLLLLSAKTPEALDRMKHNLATHLKSSADMDLADAAFTLQTGRSEFVFRQAVVCGNVEQACSLLESPKPPRALSAKQVHKDPPVVFMFPGQGAQFTGMGEELYEQETVFREVVDRCAELLRPTLGEDLRKILFPDAEEEDAAAEKIRQTRYTQPALFVIEYALANLWISWGIKPAAMIGHSVGEYVAACLAGVLKLEDALNLIAQRAELVQSMPPGSMLAVRLPEAEVTPHLTPDLAIAAVNSPNLCVVAGPHESVENLAAQFAERGVTTKQLRTSHAFHSQMMDPVVEPFTEVLRGIEFSDPKIPYISNVTAEWITADEAQSPEYWAGHVRQAVRFSDGIEKLLQDSSQVLLEVGPGRGLTQLALQHPGRDQSQRVIASLPHSKDADAPGVLAALGSLWLAGVDIDWLEFYAHERRRRVVLPTYPFERIRCWPSTPLAADEPTAGSVGTLDAETKPVVADQGESKLQRPRQAATPAAPQIARKDRLVSEIRSLLAELSGSDMSTADASVSLFEFGFDSLLLTQVATLLRKRFRAKIAFRQLMEDLSTIDAIAEYVDASLPPEPEPERQSAPEIVCDSTSIQTPETTAATGGPLPNVSTSDHGDGYVELLEQHLAVTTQLLNKMRHGRRAAIESPRDVTDGGTIPLGPQQQDALRAPVPRASHGPFRPLDRGESTPLTASQREKLDAFIERYTERTAASKKLTARNRSTLADPRSVAGFKPAWKEAVYQIHTTRSDGSRIWDVDGNEYIDFVMGFGACFFGHRPPFVVEAVKAQLDAGFETGPIHPLAGEVAGLVQELTGAERVGFCSTGSEAVLAAIRVSRTVTARDKIVIFEGAYHGIFDEVLARPVVSDGQLRSMPTAPGIPSGSLGEIIVLQYGTPESLEIIEQFGDEIAAVLVEPVQARRLDLVPKDFLLQLRQITAATGTALVFDEVVTGFRIEPGGAQAYFGIDADLAAYGKVVGGGLPIGIVTGKAMYMDALDGGSWQFGDDSVPEVGVTFFAGTFVRHPLALAAAKSVLTHIKQQGPELQSRVAKMAEEVATGFRELFDRYQAPFQLSHFSSLVYVSVPPEFKYGGLLFCHLRHRGIHIFENRLFVFTTAHTKQDAKRLLEAMEDSLKEMQQGGLLPEVTAREVISAETTKGDNNELALTQAQREIWLAAVMGEDSFRAYNLSFVTRITGSLDRRALEASIQQLVDRHDSLRAAFDLTRPVQRFLPEVKVEVPFTDLTSLDESDAERQFQELAREQADGKFEIAAPPLCRAQIVRLAPQDHRLVLTVSHLVADGWSVGVLLHELKLLYRAETTKTEPSLEPAMQFADYVQLGNSSEYQTLVRDAEEYWQERFSELPAAVELPTDRQRPPEKTYHAARETVVWDEQFTQQLRRASAEHQTTLLNLLLAGFKAVLHRLSGQEDIVVGIPAAGQISPALEFTDGSQALVGHCVNLLPVRSHCRQDQTFDAYLQSLKSGILDAYDHQSLTFSRLLELLRVPRESNRLPLVPIVFNVDRTSSGFELEGLDTMVEELGRSRIVFDIFCNIVDEEKQLRIDCEFNTDLFDAETIRRWLGYYQNLLTQAISEPDTGIGNLQILSEAERRQLLVTWNQTATEYPIESRVEALFTAQANRHPDRVAIEFEGRCLTYGELDQRSSALATELRHQQIEPGAIVGLSMERSMDMVVGILAILKSGGAFLPLDPEFPDDRIRFMIEDSGTRVILTQARLKSKFPVDHVSTICVDQLELASGDFDPPSAELKSDSIAYLIYTSGSTGKPKGVQLTHRNLVNLLHSISRQPGFTEQDVMLAVTTVSFDIAMAELFLPLTNGGKLVVASQAAVTDGHLLATLLEESGATFMQPTPATWRMLLQVGWQGREQLKMISTGEALPRDLADELIPRGKSLWNLYGPSETTIWSTGCRVSNTEGTMTVGRPIDNTEIYILDHSLQPVPLGVPGDLYIGGHGLARGYLNRPELTAERFVPHPFSGNSEDRIYKTGDLARYLPDGEIEFLGRVDNQVKIRGYRIELGEIEAALAALPEVRESVVVPKEFAAGDLRLVAYVVYRQDFSGDSTQLQSALRERLPTYMVPSSIVPLERLPQTPNGKIDRKSLAALELDVSRNEASYQAPQDQIELHLTRLWEDLLDVRPVGIRDDFFDLGGHSLLGVQMMVRIEESFGKRLPLATLLQVRTISGLAKILRSEQWQPSWHCLVPIRPGGSKPPLFLIHAAGGNVLIYDDLARHLSDEQPVYGVQAQGLDGKQTLHSSVEEMATAYRQEIQGMQPSGPYMLGGYCLGGTIALEIAAQLFERGEHVAFLGMLDSHNWAKMRRPSLFNRWLYYAQKFDFHLRNLWRLRGADKSLFFRGKLSEARRRKAVWNETIMPKSHAANGDPLNDSSLAALWANNDRIAAEYLPRQYPGRITHFCPLRNYSELRTADVGWENIAEGGVDVKTLQVYPAGMLIEPYANQLAEEMTEAIEKGLADTGKPVAVVRGAVDPAQQLQTVS